MRNNPSSPAKPGDGLETLEPRLLFCATTALFADLATDLDGWWRFDDTAAVQVADQSGSPSEHPGTLHGSADLSALGRCGGSGLFTGGTMRIANHHDINLQTHPQRTIALWFRADDIDAPGRQILYEEGAGTRGLNIYLEGGELVVGGWNRNESGWQGTWLSTDAISSGQWHHAVLTLDAGPATQPDAIHGYLDGEAFASGEASQLWAHSGSITVGGVGDTRFPDGTTGATAFNGRIDDIRLYNRALSTYDVSVLSGQFNEPTALAMTMTDPLDLHPRPDTPSPLPLPLPLLTDDAEELAAAERLTLPPSATTPAPPTAQEHHPPTGTDGMPGLVTTPPASQSNMEMTPQTNENSGIPDDGFHAVDAELTNVSGADPASEDHPSPPRITEVETRGKNQDKSTSSQAQPIPPNPPRSEQSTPLPGHAQPQVLARDETCPD